MKLLLQALAATAFIVWFAAIFSGCGPSAIVSDENHKLYVGQTVDTVARIRKYTQGSAAVATPTALSTSATALAYQLPTRLWVAGSNFSNGTNQVSVINPVTDTVVSTTNAVGQAPIGIAFGMVGNVVRAYVASRNSNSVTVLNSSTAAPIATIALPAGSAPNGIAAMTPLADSTIFVTLGLTNQLAVINATTNALVTRVAVGSLPSAVAVKPSSSEVWVANEKGNSISVLETQGYTPVTTITGIASPTAIVFGGQANVAFVAGSPTSATGVVYVIDLTTYTVIKTLTIGAGPNALAQSQHGFYLYAMNEVGNVTQIDAQAQKVLGTILTGGPARAGAIVP